MDTSFLETDGGRLAYDVQGEGPLVVLSHGMGDHRAAFRFLAPRLAEAGYRVASIDVRGHGESSTGWSTYAAKEVGRDLVALVRHLGGPAMLIGSSSSAAAPFAAQEAPDDVAGLVLISPFVRQPKIRLFLRLIKGAVMGSPRLWVMYFKSLFPAAKPADFDAYTEALLAKLKERGRMAAVSGLVAPTKEHWTDRVAEIRCPVLIVMGTRDSDFDDPEDEARLGERLFTPTARSVEVRMIADSGHYPYVDQVEATTAAILAFLKETVVA